MTWTTERVNTLMRLWNEGKSAKQISSEIGGISRNAVIGKVHRLGIAMREIDRLEELPTRGTPEHGALKTPAVKHVPVVEKTTSLVNAKKQPVSSLERTPKIMDLSENTCRWPIGDPASADFHFCGRHSVAGKPYCLEHIKMAYTPTRAQQNKNNAQKNRVAPALVLVDS